MPALPEPAPSVDPSGALVLRAPPSKSLTHRAFLLAACSAVDCVVEGPLLGADCRSTLAVLQALGAEVQAVPGGLRFAGGRGLRPAQTVLDCGNSGTTLRLLAGQCARLEGPSRLTGDSSLQGRPNGPLLAALGELGVACDSVEGRAPLTVAGPLRPGAVRLGPRVSSQYGSSLLLALALGPPGVSTVHLAAPVASRPYLELTRRMAAAFGVSWDEDEREDGLWFTVPGGQRPAAERVRIAGDWSSAAFPLVAAAITGQPLRLQGLDAHSPQADRHIVALLRAAGLRLRWEAGELVVQGRAHKALGTVELAAGPDMFPALCALAATLPGRTALVGAPSLRHKESDRIAQMAAGLGGLGVRCEERPDGLVIHGGRTGAGSVESAHDHRIYMAFRVLSLVAEGPVEVDGAGCEAVSYPDFSDHLDALVAARGRRRAAPGG
jgi:3-phosphoshikimate 1-carboxyvinyltransferase